MNLNSVVSNSVNYIKFYEIMYLISNLGDIVFVNTMYNYPNCTNSGDVSLRNPKNLDGTETKYLKALRVIKNSDLGIRRCEINEQVGEDICKNLGSLVKYGLVIKIDVDHRYYYNNNNDYLTAVDKPGFKEFKPLSSFIWRNLLVTHTVDERNLPHIHIEKLGFYHQNADENFWRSTFITKSNLWIDDLDKLLNNIEYSTLHKTAIINEGHAFFSISKMNESNNLDVHVDDKYIMNFNRTGLVKDLLLYDSWSSLY